MEELLKKHEKQISVLFRRRRINGPVNIETINQAYNRHGQSFMMELLQIITPNQTSNFTNLGQIVLPGGFVDTAVKSQAPAQPAKNKFWSFWDNLLNRVDSTGKVIGQFKYDAAGNTIYQDNEYLRQQQTQKTVVIIAAVIVVALVALLIFKKKS